MQVQPHIAVCRVRWMRMCLSKDRDGGKSRHEWSAYPRERSLPVPLIFDFDPGVSDPPLPHDWERVHKRLGRRSAVVAAVHCQWHGVDAELLPEDLSDTTLLPAAPAKKLRGAVALRAHTLPRGGWAAEGAWSGYQQLRSSAVLGLKPCQA
eukprot:197969-Chlamydomonas_euryale.AAC.1